ncbi:hypothetical protein TRAPUB_11074 [Trametes pubescens]|uniref:Uncharacterized protein n=1 Tax=Trametes pubescens TaxID=154538 RepID=A0A1M2VXX9_TRAPU|nr:hypothetical protein TRAPUB_11074 [Trametes pubescens]
MTQARRNRAQEPGRGMTPAGEGTSSSGQTGRVLTESPTAHILPRTPPPTTRPLAVPRTESEHYDLPKLLTKLKRMDSQDTAVSPVRRPSWKGALGAKLQRILSTGEGSTKDDEETLAEDVSSLKSWPARGRGKVVGEKREGE